MAKTNKIRIKLKAYDHKILDASAEKIVAAAKATAEGIHYVKTNPQSEIKSLQEFHSEIK